MVEATGEYINVTGSAIQRKEVSTPAPITVVTGRELKAAGLNNIGDILQYWSNGRYSSTQHRVINRHGVDRYSIPYFVNPGADVMIAALDGSASFTPFNYGDYQMNKWRNFFPVDEN